MTRDEFMKHAEQEIEQAFRGQRNRMMNLVEQAWAEGKRNAEEGDSYGRCRNDYAPCQNQQTDMNWFCADGEREE